MEENIKSVNSAFRTLTGEERAKCLAECLGDFVNSGGNKEMDVFVQALAREHRTLQQSSTKLMLKWIEHAASDQYRMDGRNESTHNVCKQMVDDFKVKKENYGFSPSSWLPLI